MKTGKQGTREAATFSIFNFKFSISRPAAANVIIARRMHEKPAPRKPGERTGKHYCVKCLAEVPAEEYLRNDHICDECAASDEYPLKSTPDAKKTE